MQFSILFVNSTEICTLFSVQTVAALCHHRAVTLYFNSGSLRLFACKNCRICPAPPTSGIFQTAVGTASWDSHPGMVLMPPPPLLLTVAGRKYHYPLVQVIAHLLPRKFWELVLIARLYIILRNNLEPRLVRRSAVLVRSVIRGTSWRDAPFAFNHYGLHKGKYLKYCYSIVNEPEGRICPSIIFAVGKGGGIGKNSTIFKSLFKLHKTNFAI